MRRKSDNEIYALKVLKKMDVVQNDQVCPERKRRPMMNMVSLGGSHYRGAEHIAPLVANWAPFPCGTPCLLPDPL